MKSIGNHRIISRICSALVFILLTVTLLGQKAYAASDRKALSLDDQWVSGNIAEKGEADFYSVTIPSDGWLTITYQAWNIYWSNYELYTEDLTGKVYTYEVYDSSDTNPKTSTSTKALEAGSYIVKITGYGGGHTGDYKLKGKFEPAENTEKDGNDAWASAMELKADQNVRGFFSWQDRSDFYTFSLSSPCTVQVIVTSRVYWMYFSVWNSDFIRLKEMEVYDSSEANPKTRTIELSLEPGVYYIKCNPSGSNTGRYDMKWKLAPTKVTAITITGNKTIHVGDKLQLVASVMPSNANNKTLAWSSSNTNIATVDKNTGKVTGKGIGSVRIKAEATDDSNQSAEVIVCVGPKKAGAPKASAKGNKKVQLKWKQQNGAVKYQVQYAKKKSFKKAKTWTFSSYSSSAVKKLKSKGTWYFRFRAVAQVEGANVYGAWSKPKKVKVK